MEKIEVPKTGSGDMFDPIRPDFSEVEKEGKRIMAFEVANHIYYFQTGSISHSLPVDGPGPDDLHTGPHTFVSTVIAAGDSSSGDDQGNTDFNYTVYSGLLYFNQVATTFSAISFNPEWWSCWDGSAHHIPLSQVNGNWTDIFPSGLSYSGNDFCVDIRDEFNPDGYSRDLQVVSGEINFGNVPAAIAGLAVDFSNVVLDEDGGTFAYATVTLPEDITVHTADSGTISPAGQTSIMFAGQSFSETMETLTLLPCSTSYLHSYGLPFYIDSSEMRFPLGGSSGIELVNPVPVYVHNESIAALVGTDDPRRYHDSFPANDVIFRYPLGGAENAITFNSNGLDGHLDFRADGSGRFYTSFPKADIIFNNWRLVLTGGEIDPASHLADVYLSMRFGQGCHADDCADSLAGSSWYRVSAPAAGLTPSGAFGAQFSEIGPTLTRNGTDSS